MKKPVIISAVLTLALLCSACTKAYNSNDIADYVRKTCGIRDFRVEPVRQEVHGAEDGYTDYLWTVKERDGTVFHVLDDYHWGMEALVNTLRTDYYDVHLINAYPDLPHRYFRLESSKEDGLYSAKLTAEFSTRGDLQNEINELTEIRRSADCPGRVAYNMEFSFPYRSIGEYTAAEGDTRGILIEEIPDLEEAEERMLLVCVDHRLPQLASFTEDEIKNAVVGNSHQLGIGSGDSSYIWYDDLCGNQFSYGISFGSLYELLNRSGFAVSGTPEHYSFRSADGTEYEISYSFRHPVSEGSEGYYYLKNGEETDMPYFFYNHFTAGRVKDLFGLNVTEYWMADR